jgi:hypothetical protein
MKLGGSLSVENLKTWEDKNDSSSLAIVQLLTRMRRGAEIIYSGKLTRPLLVG